jgi:hypothetical protein
VPAYPHFGEGYEMVIWLRTAGLVPASRYKLSYETVSLWRDRLGIGDIRMSEEQGCEQLDLCRLPDANCHMKRLHFGVTDWV